MERAEFERVWARVKGSGENEEALLRREIGEAEALMEVYAALASRWREGERCRREKAAEIRVLRGEYYLLTGERCGGKPRTVRGGTLSLLRQVLAGEEKAAEEYARRAGEEKTRREKLCGQLGREAARRAELLQRAIMNTMK